ncbi:diguanylate cyclase/phosphodiesterase [Desulfocucumis palustris]|uniref:Diguanylate cyclase/phosphodiesterase n=1 Tax=Desulfocucumis palustris TaxID=1898651 RepID=A0A2L2XFP5_9FIRM|nr:diguanylate cyclase/phosphodiesterase [Desulfocucumis palustris]
MWIRRLRKLGCRFVLDDFGTGFSSFSYLRILPVDYLKIDGSFVQNIEKEYSYRALVQAMNAVAHTLGKKTVAEYVENENVLRILDELKIDYAQGFFLGKPLPEPMDIAI